MYNKNKTPSHKVYLSSLGKTSPTKELTKEELKHYRKLYYLDNKERIAAKYTPVSNRSDISLIKKAFRESLGKKVKDFTIEEIKAYDKIGYSYEKYKQYYSENISEIKRKRKERHELNRQKNNALARKFYYENKDKWVGYSKRKKERMKSDPAYCRSRKLRFWLWYSLRRSSTDKEQSWLKHVGCGKKEFIDHIESQFVEGMSWDNWTLDGWHLDHIIPVAKGGTNHYTNLQPLWAFDNLSKGAKV
jgi:hypothetical protein